MQTHQTKTPRDANTLEEIVEYAEQMDNHIRSFWYMKTDLRKKPDIKFAANLLMDVQDIVWSCG